MDELSSSWVESDGIRIRSDLRAVRETQIAKGEAMIAEDEDEPKGRNELFNPKP